MTSSEVSRIIEEEIGGDWSRSNLHGVDLKRCLVLPIKQIYEDSFVKGESLSLWLVLEENPDTKDGYKIIFGEESAQFGLAIQTIFIGYYGTFLETLAGM